MRYLLILIMLVLPAIPAYSNSGAELTKKFEGFRATPYVDTVGVRTIGYSFNMKACKIKGGYMTKQTADKLFAKKYAEAEQVAKRFAGQAWDGLAISAKVCLVDMAYNLGEARLSKFRTLRVSVQDYNYKNMANSIENSLYAKQVKGRAKYHIKKIRGV